MKYALILIIFLAIFLRMYGLDSPPLFYDESVHAYFANTVLKGTYSYDPRYHGPLLFYSVAPIIAFFGETEFTLRILPALLGVAFVCSIYLYRRYLGKKVFLAMLFCAVSPVIVNYSRFYREDVYQLLFVSLAAYFLLRYLETEKKWNEVKFDKLTVFLLLSAVFLALFSAVKETFYVFAFFLLVYLFFYLTRIRISDAVTAILVFFVLYLMFYSNFFTNFSVFTRFENFPAVSAFSYWKGQHDIARLGGPPYYYLELMLLYDLPAFALGICSVYRWVRGERDIFTSFFVFLFIANFVFYSYMQEKVPWLVVHIEFPMFMLAARSAGKKSAIMTVAYLLFSCVVLNIVNPVNPAEPALYLPTQYDVREMLGKFAGHEVHLVAEIGELYPLIWYLKGYSYHYHTRAEDVPVQKGGILIANQTEAWKIRQKPEKTETMVVRCHTFWYYPDFKKIPEFLLFRKPLSPVYCTNLTVFYF
jgi:uncharacterized protein (TIGR03663 family)